MMPASPQPAGLPTGTIGGRRRRSHAAQARRWRLSQLMSNPGRLTLAAGALVLLVSALWWAAGLLAAIFHLPLPWAVAPTLAQPLVAVFGVLPLLVCGLMFSAGPRWLEVPPVAARALVFPLGLMLAGWLLALVGAHAATAAMATGLALLAAGWALLTGRFAVMVLDSRLADQDHARLLLVGNGVGVLALWMAAVTVALNEPVLARAALHGALWAGFGLVLVALVHRKLPQFLGVSLASQSAWRSRRLLAALAWLLAIQAPFAVVEAAHHGALGAFPSAVRAGLSFSGGLVLCWLALRWGLRESLRATSVQAMAADGQTVTVGRGGLRLLAMLHAGLAWLAVALCLQGVSSALLAWTDGQLSLGAAPGVAFGLGFVGCTLMALATRGSLELAGRPLRADHWHWVTACAVQAGVLFAVLSALSSTLAVGWGLLAAQFLLLAAGSWAVRHLRWLGRPERAAALIN